MTCGEQAPPEKRFVRFHDGDPLREESRAKQLEEVRAMAKQAKAMHYENGKPKDGDWCSCDERVIEMAEMIEKLHLRIDVLDPDSVRK